MIMNSTVHKQQDAEHPRLCDFCGESTALLYCRADSAKLCLACDREVHSTNQLFTKHTRLLLCDRCDSNPATIFCFTDSSVFCQNCDWESHSRGSFQSLHDRRPLEGFTGCPSVNELLGILGFDDVSKKTLLFGDDCVGARARARARPNGENVNCDNGNQSENIYAFSDMLVWETPSVVSLDDLIVSNSSSPEHNFQALGVPPLPKNRNATCGKHKEEILCQLKEMSKLEPNSGECDGETQPFIEFQPLVPGHDHQSVQKDASLNHNKGSTLASSYQASSFHCCGNGDEVADQGFPSTLLASYIDMNQLIPDKDSDVGDSLGQVNGSHEDQSHHPVATETFQTIPRVPVRELNSQERDSAISRYKEKKKTRRYDKHIRYESRKVRAESRTRVRGRFAKMEH